MNNNYIPRGLCVSPLSAIDIRKKSDEFRALLGVVSPPVDIQHLIEFELPKYGIDYDVKEIEEMEGLEAEANPAEGIINLRIDTYIGLTKGDRRARYTAAHELGHIILRHQPSLGYSETRLFHKPFQDSEWQADAFAAEFLMPHTYIAGTKKTAVQISEECQVSLKAASLRLKILRSQGLVRLS